MDSTRFDRLAKRLALRASRRSVIKGLGGGAVVGALAVTRYSRTDAAQTVGVCHRTAAGSYRYIEVAPSAAAAHHAHGDVVGVDPCGGACCATDQFCEANTCVACLGGGAPCGDYRQCCSGICDPYLGGRCRADS